MVTFADVCGSCTTMVISASCKSFTGSRKPLVNHGDLRILQVNHWIAKATCKSFLLNPSLTLQSFAIPLYTGLIQSSSFHNTRDAAYRRLRCRHASRTTTPFVTSYRLSLRPMIQPLAICIKCDAWPAFPRRRSCYRMIT